MMRSSTTLFSYSVRGDINLIDGFSHRLPD